MRRTSVVVSVLAGLLLVGVPVSAADGAAQASHKPLAGVVIAIDPGHNGGNSSHPTQVNRKVWIGNAWKVCNTSGTSTNAGYAEHRFTWALARLLRSRLQALGATVKMTRSSDTGWGPCSTTRGKFGAKVHADLMISLHGDGLASSQHGFVVIRPGRVKGYTDDIYSRSKTLSLAMRAGLGHAKVSRSTAYGGDGLDVRTDLGTLNLSNVPAVLIELGNMRNAHDAALMSSSSGRGRYAGGLVFGIRKFLHK
jgi:N-acetylmuramoyl-L-alanine amidase